MVPKHLMSDFAEVCGIHSGDGWMGGGSYNYEIGYGTSPKEEQYFQEVLSLYKRIFSPQKVRILRRLAIEFRFSSREGQNILREAGFPRGKKLDNLRVPDFVYEDAEYVKRFVRGVMDTDGHVYWRKSVNNHYLVLCWSTTNLKFAQEIFEILKTLGYHPRLYSSKGTKSDGRNRRDMHRIIIMKFEDIKKYLEEIGFSNNVRRKQVTKRFEDIGRYNLNESTITFLSRFRVLEASGPVV